MNQSSPSLVSSALKSGEFEISLSLMPRSARVNKVSALLNQSDADDTYTPSSPSSPSKALKSKSALERRRAVHLRCEHRRRKEIQDALDALSAELPPAYKPRSKNAIIVDATEYIQQLTLSLDCLIQENQQLSGLSM